MVKTSKLILGLAIMLASIVGSGLIAATFDLSMGAAIILGISLGFLGGVFGMRLILLTIVDDML